jgi:hypothetical protein
MLMSKAGPSRKLQPMETRIDRRAGVLRSGGRLTERGRLRERGRLTERGHLTERGRPRPQPITMRGETIAEDLPHCHIGVERALIFFW